jgi:hypothetical protein
VVGREAMTGGSTRENEKEEKKMEIKSNLKLAIEIYSNLIRSK